MQRQDRRNRWQKIRAQGGLIRKGKIVYLQRKERKTNTQTKMGGAEETLELIREGFYNTDRPSNLIIKELVEVIKLLDNKLNHHGII